MNSFLTQVIMDLKSGDIRRCETYGLTLEEIQELNQITVDDLHYLVSSRVSVITLNINHTNLALLLEQSRRERERIQRIDRALAVGASIAMLDHFFGLTTAEVSARRRIKGIDARQGRVMTPTEEEEKEIWLLWEKMHCDNLDDLFALDAMILIAEQLNISVTAIWPLIKTWSNPTQHIKQKHKG